MKGPFIFLCSEISEDIAFKLINWLQDGEVTRYLSDSKDDAVNVRRIVEELNMPDLTHLFNQSGRFFIAYDSRTRPVGFVRLVVKEVETEIILAIGERSNWGKRFGTSVILESLKIAFFELRSPKVTAKINRENTRSIGAFKRVGFKLNHEAGHIKNFSMTIDEYIELIKGAVIMPTDIFITEIDKSRLERIIGDQYYRTPNKDKTIRQLIGEIGRAEVVGPEQVPFNVVTMNSRVLLHMDDEKFEVSLVYPDQADWSGRRLSIFSPIGTAILGYKEGDRISWEVPSGVAEIYIEKILYQPEAAGDYHL